MTTTHLTLEESAGRRAWTLFREGKCLDVRGRDLDATLAEWSRTTTGSGVMLSARVHGPDALEAVQRFALADSFIYGRGPKQKPHLDYSTPGRVACVWQSGGVWFEIWHPDTSTASEPAPVQAPARRRFLLSRPSARLPYTRKARAQASSSRATDHERHSA